LPPTNNNPKEKKTLPKNLEKKAAQKESVQETYGSQILCTPRALTFMLPIGQCEEPHETH
jgi:hypothetical protein